MLGAHEVVSTRIWHNHVGAAGVRSSHAGLQSCQQD